MEKYYFPEIGIKGDKEKLLVKFYTTLRKKVNGIWYEWDCWNEYRFVDAPGFDNEFFRLKLLRDFFVVAYRSLVHNLSERHLSFELDENGSIIRKDTFRVSDIQYSEEDRMSFPIYNDFAKNHNKQP